METCKLSVALHQKSYEQARRDGWVLYAAAGAAVPTGGGRPLVWFGTAHYGMMNHFWCSAGFRAYVAEPLQDGDPIRSYSEHNIQLGQKLVVVDDSGCTEKRWGSDNSIIAVENTRPSRFSVGLTGRVPNSNRFAPICTVPLRDHGTVNLKPAARIALFFSAEHFPVGLPVGRLPSRAVRVELAGVTSRQVSYNTERTWGWPDGARGISILEAGTDLATALISS